MITEFAVRLTPEGMLPIPERLQQELGLKPYQTLYLRRDANTGEVVISLLTRQEIGERIKTLMREAFQDVAWANIKQGRTSDADRG